MTKITTLLIKEYLLIVFIIYNSAFTTIIKGAPSSLRQFLATESPLKVMKSHFYFTLKTRLILKIFKFLS